MSALDVTGKELVADIQGGVPVGVSSAAAARAVVGWKDDDNIRRGRANNLRSFWIFYIASPIGLSLSSYRNCTRSMLHKIRL